MKIIVDTCIWSLAFRRENALYSETVQELKQLILDQRVQMLGPIRQELLSGIRLKQQFNDLKSYLQAFPDLQIKTLDYELAAEFYNINRKKGIQGSNTDFLICALSCQNNMPIFTLDKDFELYKNNIPIVLYQLSSV